MTQRPSVLLSLMLLGSTIALQAQDQTMSSKRFTLSWPANAQGPRPVCAEWPEQLSVDTTIEVQTLPDTNARTVPAQRDPVHPKRIWWIAEPPIQGLETHVEIRSRQKKNTPSAVAIKTRDSLILRLGDKPVLAYRYTPMSPPPEKSRRYTRSAFIHPLFSPRGDILTAIQPPDHIHHMGIWNPWTNTTFEGRQVDFWNLRKGQGTVRFKRFESTTNGPVFAGFRAQHEHVDLKAPGGEQVVLEEVWEVRAWNWNEESFLIDMVITQTCVADVPLELHAYRYGGLAFRGRTGWHASNSDYLTSEGKTRADGHASRARWCHAYGETPKGGAGVLFMSHPENREHPEPVRLWRAGANGGRNNLFFNFCPVQKKPWILEPDKTYTLRYRVNVYPGKPSQNKARSLWHAFATAPVIQ